MNESDSTSCIYSSLEVAITFISMEPKHKNLLKAVIGVGCLAVAYYLLTLFRKRDKQDKKRQEESPKTVNESE